MEPKTLIAAFDKLEMSEKIVMIEDLWDSIAKSNDSIPLPEWQKAELSKRYQEFLGQKLPLHSWSNVHDELRNKS